MPVDRNAATFDAFTIYTAREALKADIEGVPSANVFLDAEPMYVNLKKDIRLPVFLSRI